jgi:hypothetical protein
MTRKRSEGRKIKHPKAKAKTKAKTFPTEIMHEKILKKKNQENE